MRAVLILSLAAVAVAPAQVLDRVEVSGPGFVVEGGQGQFRATAVYDDNSTQDVTATVTWSISPDRAGSFDSVGVLAANALVDCSRPARVTASYGGLRGRHDIFVRTNDLAGSSVRFDGLDDFLSVPNSDSLQFGQQATVEVWFRVDAPPPGSLGYWVLFEAGGPFGFSVPPGSELAALFDFRLTPSPGPFIVLGGGVPPSRWVHLAATIDTAIPVASLYLDGVLVSQQSTYGDGTPIPPSNLVPLDQPLIMGGAPGYTNYFPGHIDEVRIWTLARSADELRDAMFARLVGTEPNLVGYWRFDEGSGQTVQDLTAFGNDGHLGIDGSNPDGADPAWMISAAPIGSGVVAPIADITGDGVVGLDDLSRLLSHFGDDAAEYDDGDIDGDGDVDLSDLAALLAAFGTVCP